VFAITIYHTPDLGLWVRYKRWYADGCDPSDKGKLGYGWICKQIPPERGRREVEGAGHELFEAGAAPPPEVHPVICSQADVARLVGRSVHTTGLMDILVNEGTVKYYERPSRRGGKLRVWFSDPEFHRKALEKIAERTPRRGGGRLDP
jgi:hypothetical protein